MASKTTPLQVTAFPIGQSFMVPLADGRATVCRVIAHRGTEAIIVAVSRWIGDAKEVTPHLLARLEIREVLRLTHHRLRNQPAIFSIDFSVLHQQVPGTRRVGTIAPSAQDLAVPVTPGAWGYVASHALMQWRWENDREGVHRETRARARAAKAQRLRDVAEMKARRSARAKSPPAKGPTLGVLARRALFASWESSVPRKTVAAAKAAVRDAIERLRERPRSARGDLAEIRRGAKAFNRLDAGKSHFIGTLEAEEIHAALCDVGRACGLDEDDVAEAIDAVREW